MTPRLIRWLDWRLIVAVIGLIVVGSFCWNSIKATDRADRLAGIAAASIAREHRAADETAGLRAEITDLQRQLAERAQLADRRARAQADRADLAADQSKAQRKQIALLVRFLRVNGLDVPALPAAPAEPKSSDRTPPTPPAPTPSPDQPGRSDEHRAKPKKGKP